MEEIIKGDNCFYIGDPREPLAEITFFQRKDGVLVIDHTYVAEAARGQGIARQLVLAVAELARAEKRRILPVCSYAKAVMTRDAVFADVLNPAE